MELNVEEIMDKAALIQEQINEKPVEVIFTQLSHIDSSKNTN